MGVLISFFLLNLLIIIAGIGLISFGIVRSFDIGIQTLYIGLGFLILVIGIFIGRRESRHPNSG